jgi:thiol-disulfide isomerase/thioredoxin
MRTIGVYLCCIIIGCMVAACDRQSDEKEAVPDHSTIGRNRSASASVMPHFALPAAVDGSIVDSDEFEGSVRLVNFFATWCPPCKEEVPNLIKLVDKYGNQGLSVIGLSVDQGGPEIVKKFVNKMKVNYPVLVADDSVTYAFGGVSSIPVSFLVAADGTMIRRYLGYVDQAILERDVKEVLGMERGSG